MRIIFMGTPEFALPSLEAIRQRPDELLAVVTQPDRPSGRGQKPTPSPVKLAAIAAGLAVVQPEKVRDPGFLEWCRGLAPDVIVVVAFGQLLPKALIDIPRHGCLNVHASLLPRYRGAAPIHWALIRDERETGVTTMQIDIGMDTGPMYLQRATPITAEDTAETLAQRLSILGAQVLNDTLDLLAAGRLVARPQDSSQATLAPLLKKEDGRIDWTRSATAIAALIRGTTPWPGAHTSYEQDQWRIWRAYATAGSGAPGIILRADAEGVVVGTREGRLVITELQAPGGKRLKVREYLAGHLVKPGNRLV